MAAKPKPTPQKSAEPTALEIAMLAARLLPPMKLDDNWATEHPVTVARRANDGRYIRDKRWGCVGGGRGGSRDIRFRSGE